MSYLLWYAKDKTEVKTNPLYKLRKPGKEGATQYTWIELENGERRRLTKAELSDQQPIPEGRVFRFGSLYSQHPSETRTFTYEYEGKKFHPGTNRQWSTSLEGLELLKEKKRLIVIGNTLGWVLYLDEVPTFPLTNIWTDTVRSGFSGRNIYVTQTNTKVIERCIQMSTEPGDLVFDPTCGSGTTAYASERWGRRWITCDTSRVAITLSRQRLMTATFDYYKLINEREGIVSGFRLKKVPHITLKSITSNSPVSNITLYDDPIQDKTKLRITGPFTVEAVPAPVVKPLTDIKPIMEVDSSVTREGETLRQSEWRWELLTTGIRGRNGQKIEFTRIEALSGTHWLHANAETKEDEPKRAVISFGPEFAPLGRRQVELAIEEAQRLVPRPKLIIFCSFLFDPEASKDIYETDWPGVTLVKVQMNADLLTDDLKKERASNESFWLVGQPDIKLQEIHEGEYKVEVQGFDYYNPTTGEIESGGPAKIALWMLDTDYDYRSLFPRQVFFPMSSGREGWSHLARTLKSEIDEELIERYRGIVSLPFTLGVNKSIAIKIIDDRGIESLKPIKVD